MIDHPVFRRFEPYRKRPDDWLGAKFAVNTRHMHPWFNDEVFEWIAMLRAALDAQDRFTMIELGAGFGRWAIAAGLAASRVGSEHIELRLVEAEPQHAIWARESLQMNGLANKARVFEAALSNSPEPVLFAIDAPAEKYTAESWYGQQIIGSDIDPAEPTEETYFGHRIYRGKRVGQIYVPTVSLETVVEGLDLIDLIDADLQGAETELIPAMDLLNERARLVHIGTHSVEIEAALREAFGAQGWICEADYSLQGEHDTPFGRISFSDGAQTWRNSRL
jgi:FkbM family methyltransferase